MWLLLIDEKQPVLDSPVKQEAARTMSDVMLCKQMGWTFYDLLACPDWFYEDMMNILAMQAQHEKNEMEKAKSKSKSQNVRRR